MLNITKQGNSIVVKGLDHALYPYSGTLEIPCNSVITVVDEGDIVTFRSASNYDVLFSGLVSEITINGEAVTKENVGDKFGAISNTSSGGGGGLTPEQEEKLNNAVQIADYNADKEAQATIDESQNAAIEGLSGDIEGKQDKIDDLDAIRDGAAKGSTALQEETDPVWNAEKGNYYTKGETDGLVNEAKTAASNAMSVAASAEGIASAAHSMADEALEELNNKADKGDIPSLDGYATESWVEGKGYLTEHQDISGKLDKTEAAETYQPKGNYATKDEIPSLDGYATEEWVEGKGYLTEHQDISGKQDVITDLGEIREGAALGKTALQSFTETDPVWTAEKGNYYTKDEADGKFLTEHQDISGKLDKSEAEETYQPKGDYALKNDLEGYVDVETYNKHITDQTAVDEAQNSAIEGIEGDISRIDSKIDDIELFKFPNATIIGEPTIQSGQVSNFSSENYLQFPFVLDLRNQTFQIDFCFTTYDDVSGQQNVLDSKFGIALAVKDGKGLMAISSNGSSWNIGSVTGSMNIEPNTTYYARLTWDGNQYKTFLSTDGTSYTQDMVLNGTERPFPTTIFIGGCDLSETGHTAHPFLGTINMNKAQLTVMGNVVWQGMDDAGLATRLATNLNNIDEVGKERIKEIVGTIPTKTSELTNDSGFLTEHQSLAEYAKTADVEATYQPKGDYLTEETDPVWESEKGNYYDKEEIEGMFAQADATYQPKGDYATKDEIPSLDGYATEEWVGEQGFKTQDDYWYITWNHYYTNKLTFSLQRNGTSIKTGRMEVYLYSDEMGWTTVTAGFTDGYWQITRPNRIYTAFRLYYRGDVTYYSPFIPYVENIQPTLVSGTNIKTINGESILGSGNIEIQGGGGDETDPIWTAEKVNYYTKTEVDEMIGNINNALAKLING